MRWWSQDQDIDHRKVVEEERFTSRTERLMRSTSPPPYLLYMLLISKITCIWVILSDPSSRGEDFIQDLKQKLQKPCCTSASLWEVYYQTLTEQIFLSVCTGEQQTQIIYTCYRTERRLGLSVSLRLSIPLVWPGLACLCSLYSFNEDFKCIST